MLKKLVSGPLEEVAKWFCLLIGAYRDSVNYLTLKNQVLK